MKDHNPPSIKHARWEILGCFLKLFHRSQGEFLDSDAAILGAGIPPAFLDEIHRCGATEDQFVLTLLQGRKPINIKIIDCNNAARAPYVSMP